MNKADRRTLWGLAFPGLKTIALLIILEIIALILVVLSGLTSIEIAGVAAMLKISTTYLTSVCKLLLILDIMLICYFAVDPIAAQFTMMKNLRLLKLRGCVTDAATSLRHALASKEMAKETVIVSDGFVFVPKRGIACACDDILWCYTRKQNFFFVSVRDVLLLCLCDGQELVVESDYTDKRVTGSIGHVMERIFALNPDMPFGYTIPNRNAYRKAVSNRKEISQKRN